MPLHPYLPNLNNDHFTQVHLTLFYKMRKQAKWLSNILRYLRQVCVRNKVQSSMCLKAQIFLILLKNERLETEWVVKRSKWLTNQERKATCPSLILVVGLKFERRAGVWLVDAGVKWGRGNGEAREKDWRGWHLWQQHRGFPISAAVATSYKQSELTLGRGSKSRELLVWCREDG